MAGRYTDEERLARGQYLVYGQWYTSSGYPIRNAAADGADTVLQSRTSSAMPALLGGSYDYYDAAIRQEQNRQAQSELQRQAGEAAIRLLEDRRTAAAIAAERAVRQAYVAHMSDRRALAQQLAAQGASGGMTDTAYLRLLAGYENRRGGILARRDRDLL